MNKAARIRPDLLESRWGDPTKPDLERTLGEMGPNHVSEFADELRRGMGLPDIPNDPLVAIGEFREAMTAFLVRIDHAFIGGVAARTYKARTGATFDYDVMIAPHHLQEVNKFLESQGGFLRGTVENTYLYTLKPANLNVDIRVARHPMDREALERAKPATYGGRKLRVVRPEYLAAMKVRSYSERAELPKGRLDRQDIEGLLLLGATSPEAVGGILKKHRPELLPVLEKIVKELSRTEVTREPKVRPSRQRRKR